MLRRNLIANYLGQGWAGVMGLVFVPQYVSYLGIESYGLIGLFAVTLAWLVLLDMGMSPTLGREMARYTSGARSAQAIRDLLRSLEIVTFSVAAIAGLSFWAASAWIAGEWLKVENLPRPVVAQALSIMALVIALRFCEGIYRSAIVGLQEQVWLNWVNAMLATFRHAGAVAVLAFVSPSILAFFYWQAFISLLTICAFALRLYRLLPPPLAPARFSLVSLKSIWRFAGGITGITFLALLLTQVDKVLLSRLLTLEHYGHYMLAATVAGTLSVFIGPVAQALYPRLVECAARNDQAGLQSAYHQGAQLVAVLTAPAAMLVCFFSTAVMYTWTGDANLSENTGPLLSVLVFGTFLNGLMQMPYLLQLAHGWTALGFRTNLMAIVIFVPSIFWTVPRYGVLGAAWIWVALNAGYVMISIQFMHRRLIPSEKWRWYAKDILLPAAGAAVATGLAQLIQPVGGRHSRLHWLVWLVSIGCLASAVALSLSNQLRPKIQHLVALAAHRLYARRS